VPLEAILLDDGKDADVTANDALYSRYFARFDDDGRYTIKCQVEGNEDTQVVDDFYLAKKLSGANSQAYPILPNPNAPLCCGGDALPDRSLARFIDTGAFTRNFAVGSVKVSVLEEATLIIGRFLPQVSGSTRIPGDPFLPEKILDLTVEYISENKTIAVTFTSPRDTDRDGEVVDREGYVGAAKKCNFSFSGFL